MPKAYGNLINRVIEDSASPAPAVGMGATILWWSDRTPATVTKVSPSGKTVTLTEDRITGWENHYGTSFAPNPNGRVFVARKNRYGRWKTAGNGVTLGSRAAYRDPSF
jgi:hypothetical protein